MKVEAAKFSHTLKKKQESNDKSDTKDKNWTEDMADEFVVEEAPAEVQEFFDHLDNITSKKAVFMMVDGTISDEVGASTLAKKANAADGAIAMIVNGPVSERTLEIASEAAIPTVIGTKAGKGFAVREDVKAWLSEEHR
jgi:hypothetical protein